MIKNPSNFTNNKKSHDALKILNEGLIHANPQIGLKKYFFRNKIKTKSSIINLKNFENFKVSRCKPQKINLKFTYLNLVSKSLDPADIFLMLIL